MSDRIELLDAWRGLACWLMLAYHLAFDLAAFGWMKWQTFLSTPMNLLERFIAFSFILCAGICSHLTRSNWKRGLVTAGAGLVVVAASFVVEMPILFGVLQFLSAAMLLYWAAGRWVDKLPFAIAPFLWMGLYALTYFWTKNTWVETKWLFWLGFRYDGFQSYDYFPMMPYIFLFFLGTWMGRWLREHRALAWLHRPMPGCLTWMGRHTLIIYLLHQPALYGLCLGAFCAIRLCAA